MADWGLGKGHAKASRCDHLGTSDHGSTLPPGYLLAQADAGIFPLSTLVSCILSAHSSSSGFSPLVFFLGGGLGGKEESY